MSSSSTRRWIKRFFEAAVRSRASSPRARRRESPGLSLEHLETRIVPAPVGPGKIHGLITGSEEFNVAGGVYEIDSTLRITSAGSLKVDAGVTVQIDDGVQIFVDGTLTTPSGGTAPIFKMQNTGTSGFGGITVDSGGILNLLAGTFSASSTTSADVAALTVNPGAKVTADSCTFGWGQFFYDPQTTAATNSLTRNTFNTTLFTRATDVGSLVNNQSFRDVDFLQNDQVPATQSVLLGLMGTSTTNLRYVFQAGNFVINPQASLEIGSGVSVLIRDGATITDNGTLTTDANSTVSVEDLKSNMASGIVVNGTMSATSTTFQVSTRTGTDTSGIQVNGGATFQATGSTFGFDQFNFGPGYVLGPTDLSGNAFNTALSVPAADVNNLGNNASFEQVSLLPNDVVMGGQTVNLALIGLVDTSNLHYVIPGPLTVLSGGTLEISRGVNVEILEGQTVTVNGTMSVTSAAVEIDDNGTAGAPFGIQVQGILSAVNASFVRAGSNGSDTTSIEIGAGGSLTASGSTFGWDQLKFDSPTPIAASTLTNNTFNTTVMVPLVDVPGLANNSQFQQIVINANDMVPSGVTFALPRLGGNFTSYVLGGAFTVPQGASLEIGNGVELTLATGFALTVNGTLQIDPQDHVEFPKNAANVLTDIVVAGKLIANDVEFDGGPFTGVGTTAIEVASGGRITATGSDFSLDRVDYGTGSLLSAGDLTGNSFDGILSLPIAELPLIGNSASIREVEFPAGDSVPSGSTFTLAPISSSPHTGNGNVRPLYVFPSGFTVQAGGTLDIAANVPTEIPEGVVLTVNGTLNISPHTSVVIDDLNNNERSGITVAGTLNATQVSFTRGPNPGGSDIGFIEVTSGGQFNATDSTFTLDQLNLDPGSTDVMSTNLMETALTIDSAINSGSSLTQNDFSPPGTKVIATGATGTTITLTNNFWGTAATDATILAQITDSHVTGDAALPTVVFDPFGKVPPTQTVVSSTVATFSESPQSVNLQAFVFSFPGAVNQGTVQFSVFDGNGNQVGSTVTSLPVSNDTANVSFTLPANTPPGVYSIHAFYVGGGGFIDSMDLSQTLTVTPVATTTVAANTSTPFSYSQQSVTLSANVISTAGIVAEGSVTFSLISLSTGLQVGSAVTGQVNASGIASANFSLPAGAPVGLYQIFANYSGDNNFAPSSDMLRDVTVNRAATSVSVSTTPVSFSYSAQTLSPVATIQSSAGAAQEGTVTFKLLSTDGVTVISTDTESVSGGTATAKLTLPAQIGPNTYFVSASYSGGPDLLSSSTSAPVSETVQAATTATQASNATASFSASAQTVVLTATVTSPAGTVIEGTVTFSVFGPGNTPIGTVTSGSPPLGGHGTVSVNFPLPAGLAPGSYSIDAAYNGDVNLQSSTDTTHTLTITGAPTTTAVANATVSFSESAQFVTVNATLTSAGGSVNQGSVAFVLLDGGGHTVAAGTGTVTGTNPVSTTLVLPASLAPGVYTISAVYGGSTDFQGSSDNTHTLTVAKAATTSTAFGATASFSDGDQTLSLSTALSSPAGPVFGGTVTFTVRDGGGHQVGSAVTSSTASASFVLPGGTPAGTYTIDAAFGGGTDFLASTDTTGTLTVSQSATATSESPATSTFSRSSPPVTLQATVTGPTGPVNEGTVVFTVLNGAAVIGVPVSSPVAGGVASATFTVPAGTSPGTYTLLARYSDSPANFTASSNLLTPSTLTVGPAPTATAVTPADVAAAGSQPVVLVATVSSPDGQVNEGTVTFSVFSGGTQIGVSVTSGTVGAGSAKANFTIPAGTNPGTYTVRASYSGGPDFQGSTTTSGTLLIDLAPVVPPINGGNPVTLSHDGFPFSTPVGATSPLGNPLTYSVTVVGDSVLFDLQQQLQFRAMGNATTDATAFVLSANAANKFGNNFYLIRPSDGALFAYDGSGSYAHTFANVAPLATLGTNVYTDPNLLLNALPPVDYTTLFNLQNKYQFTGVGYVTAGATAYVLHSNQAGPGVGGFYLLGSNGALFAYDGSGDFARSFASSAPIAQLSPTVYSFPSGLVNATANPTLYAQLYQLNQQYDLQELGGSFFTNTLGHQAKWVYSPVLNQFGQHWYTLTLSSDGTQAFLRAWQGYQDSATGPVLATLDPSVYANPTLLTNATALPNPAVSASVNASGNLLVALPGLSNFTGTFRVIVTASDGFLSTSTTALFNSTDSAPTLSIQNGATTVAPGGTQSAPHGSFPVTDTVTTSDAEGDGVTTSASVTSFSLPFSLQQHYRFTSLGTMTAGATASLLRSDVANSFGNQFYLLKSDGGLYAYDGSGSFAHTFANVTPLATLSANTFVDINLLLNALPPVDYATLFGLQQQFQFTAVGSFTAGATAFVLHTNQAGAGVGGFYLLSAGGGLYAYDGSGSFAHTFANSANLIASLDPAVFVTPSILLGANAAPGLYPQLFQAEQQFDLQQQGGSFFTGLMGHAAKWLFSPVVNANGQHWYTLVLAPDGNEALLYAWDGGTSSVPTGATPLASFDPSVYADPTLLTNAKAPLLATGVTANVTGNSLTIGAPASFVGSFEVTVTASDGLKSTTQTFFFTSTDAPPAPAAIAPQTASQATPLQLPLSATDADGDTVSFTATVSGYNPAFNLQQIYHFTGVGFATTGSVSAFVMRSSVLGGAGGLYLVSTTGGVYAYDGSGNFATTFANSANLIATLNPGVFSNPTLLTNAQAPAVPAALATVNSTTLTVNVAGVPVGTVFEVFVTASDGAETTRTGFLVTVTA
jgi:hypothetical protein